MEVNQILCMNGGVGETSYANNSIIQKWGITMVKPILQQTINELLSSISFPECLTLADLGCSSGPNTLSVVWEIMSMIDQLTCQNLNCKKPVFHVFLNDLFGNDFNTIFKSLPSFYEKMKKEKGSDFGPCFIAAMPGSFYGRLFPNNSLHFVHSSASLHWLSRVPEGLTSEGGIPLNKRNIYIAKTSPQSVHKAYKDVFEKDFTTFLRSRAEEMICGGHMFLITMGNSSSNSYTYHWELLGNTLHDMVLEGLVEESTLDMFNLPYYAPIPEDLKNMIQTEGSFKITKFETFKMKWNANIEKSSNFDIQGNAKYVSMSIRVVAEPLLAHHFGYEIMADLFERFGNKIEEHLEANIGEYLNIVLSMIKV